MKTIAIMQPYIFPYLPYFQLFKVANIFVFLDDVQYISRGLVNRNRILYRGAPQYITFPLKKASQTCKINERIFADNIEYAKSKIHRQLYYAYSKAPYFRSVYPLLESIIFADESNLAKFAEYSHKVILDFLDISVETIRSSDLNFETSLKGEEHIFAIVKACGGTRYVNPIGGYALYTNGIFEKESIELRFLKSTAEPYKQFSNEFVPNLSIIDVLMFNSKTEIRRRLTQFELLSMSFTEQY